ERPPVARAAEAALEQTEARFAELGRLRTSLEVAGALPFFSFGVHFAEAAEHGFDLILSNPPWVRAHRWPAAVNSLVRRRYAVCRSPGWRRGAELAGAPVAAGAQADLALLFLERSLRRLAPGGVLAMLLPAKMLRSMYGAGGRRLLLGETELIALVDHSLDQRAIVRADAFAAAVVARKRAGVAAVGIAGRGSGDDAGSLDRTGPPGGAGIRTADAPPAGDRGAVIGAAARRAARRFEELWAAAHDVLPVVEDAIARALREVGPGEPVDRIRCRIEGVAPPAGTPGHRGVQPSAARARTPALAGGVAPRGGGATARSALRPAADPSPGDKDWPRPVFELADFQRDAVRRASRILAVRRGVLIADSVGRRWSTTPCRTCTSSSDCSPATETSGTSAWRT